MYSSTEERGANKALKKAEVVDGVKELNRQENARTNKAFNISKDRWLQELARIAFNDSREYFDESGKPLPIKKLSKQAAAAISRFEVIEDYDTQGDHAATRQRYRLLDKLAALQLLESAVASLEINMSPTQATSPCRSTNSTPFEKSWRSVSLGSLSPDKQSTYLNRLSPTEATVQMHTWTFWARPTREGERQLQGP